MRTFGILSVLMIVIALASLWSYRVAASDRGLESSTGSPAKVASAPVHQALKGPLPVQVARQNVLPQEELGASAVHQQATLALDEEEPATGEVYGTIVTTEGLRLERGRVLVFANKKASEPIEVLELQGGEREFRCELPARKSYWLIPDPDSMEGDYLPALAKSLERGTQDQTNEPEPGGDGKPEMDHYSFAFVSVVGGESQRLDLTVGLPAQVAGRLLSTRGEPIPGVHVQLAGISDTLAGLTENCTTGADGSFQFPYVFPGEHRLFFYRAEAWTPPAPIDLSILGGECRWLGDIRVGAGDRSIRGQVVDQDGQPFPGLPILCFSNMEAKEGTAPHKFNAPLANATTDESGVFVLQNLPAAPVQVSLTPEFDPRKVGGKGYPAMWVKNVPVDLGDGPFVQDVGTHVVEESRPFEITGHFEFDSGWLVENVDRARNLQVTLNRAEGQTLPEGIRRVSLRKWPVAVDLDEGTFRTRVETPNTDLELRFKLQGAEDLVFVLQPQPFDSWYQSIRVPGDF